MAPEITPPRGSGKPISYNPGENPVQQSMVGIEKNGGIGPSGTAVVASAGETDMRTFRDNVFTLPAEHEFIGALFDRKVFTAFQPVVDRNMALQGFELLARWERNGLTLLPGDFFPGLRSVAVWRALTWFVLENAVRSINRFGNLCYFAVNIPACIAASHDLILMVLNALQQLHAPVLAGRLVLEIAETTDFYQHKQARINVSTLIHTGVHVLQDDCFSVSGAPFPPLDIPFSGYKLDMGIVKQARNDMRARTLIKNFTHYCRRTERRCVAEGIETPADFSLLSSLGVNNFQGFLIASPVREEVLGELIGTPKICNSHVR